jgi:hypothetical protein
MPADRYSDLRERTKAYASRIIRLYTHLQHHHFNDAALVLGKQLLRSGTSVAANHRESKHSRSKADRAAKYQIILQELERAPSGWIGDDYDPALSEPAQNHLRHALLVLVGDGAQQLVLEDVVLALGKRPPGLDLHAVLLQELSL